MTYDDWKLETPEDEAHRKGQRGPQWGWRGPPEKCPNCGATWDSLTEDGTCYECGIDPTIDAHGERDPDDARDQEQDRYWERDDRDWSRDDA